MFAQTEKSRVFLAVLVGVFAWQAFQVYTVIFWTKGDGPTTEELIKANGYSVEVHKTQTDDGYILPLQRIVNPRMKEVRKRKPPVLIMHGLFSCSAVFVSLGRENSLAFILADQGYDVWLGNMRGNKYAREHVLYNSSDPKFWNFSVDDVSTSDLPALINRVLEVTENKKLSVLGHSLGYSTSAILLSVKPEWNEKLVLLLGLAPVAFVNEVTNSLLRFIFHQYTPFMRERYGEGEWLPNIDKIYWKICDERLLTYYLCAYVYSQIGPHDEYDSKNLKLYLSNSFTSTSLKVLEHGRQLLLSVDPCSFQDPSNNITCSIYPQENIVAPVALIYGENDNIATASNIRRMKKITPQIVDYKIAKHDFNHMDFLFGASSKELVSNKVLRLLKAAYEKDQQ